MRLNKEIISAIVFLAFFIIFILSSYGIGKAESDNDETTKNLGVNGLILSTVSMIVLWTMNWGITTPNYIK